MPSLAQLPSWCIDLPQWQRMASELIESADQVFCPCKFTLEILRAHYSNANYRHCYHPDWELDAPYPAVAPTVHSGGKMRVAVLGMLSREKGADRLDECAIAVRENGYPIEFVLFGQSYGRAVNRPRLVSCAVCRGLQLHAFSWLEAGFTCACP
jgi:glycosyltransferase involved in cell wall biosynthesis